MKSTRDIIITAGLDLGGFGSDVNALTDSLTKLDRSLYGSTFTHANEMTQAFRNIGGSVLNAAESIPIFGQGLKLITSGFAQSAIDANSLNVSLTTQAESYDQLIAKFSDLEKQRAHARANDNNNAVVGAANNTVNSITGMFGNLNKKRGGHDLGGRLAEEEGQITKELSNITAKYTANIEEETKALDASDIATIRRVRLAKLDIDAQAKIADVAQRLKNPKGELAPQAQTIVGLETKRILKETEVTKQALELTLKKEESERDINNILATRGITIEDELHINEEIQNKLWDRILLLQTQGKSESLLYSQLKAEVKQYELQGIQIQFNRDKAQRQATAATEASAAQLTGNRLIASEAEIRAKYEEQIKDALRVGNQELAHQLEIQQRLETIRARAAYDLMSPGQRRQQRNEARRLGRALQREASRDRINAESDNPALRKAREKQISEAGFDEGTRSSIHGGSGLGVNGRASQRDYIPASTLRTLGATGANAPKVGTLQVSTLNVTTIKTAP